jgi:hypothetical protein
MNRARSFFYVCLGILALAIAYHFGATTATAQAPGNPVVGFVTTSTSAGQWQVITANGDIYIAADGTPYHYWGNVFRAATPAQGISIGQLKAKYATPAGGK